MKTLVLIALLVLGVNLICDADGGKLVQFLGGGFLGVYVSIMREGKRTTP